jgi:hypothetical protein
MATPTFETCPPGNYNIVKKAPISLTVQQWRTNANQAGRKWGMNPVTFLALAALETDGDATVIKNSFAYGICGTSHFFLDPYNCSHGTSFKLTDLVGQGPNVWTLSGGVDLSFDILGQHMIAFNRYANSFKLTATAWNGTGCGATGSYLKAFGAACPGIAIPQNASLYGEAAFKLASDYSGWWIDPSSGQPNSYYFADLAPVPAVGPPDPYATVTVVAKLV